jgi:site-specific DNA recombinase
LKSTRTKECAIMVYQPEYEQYRGLRGLILTRVSTGPQAKKFSPAAQERNVRRDITTPLMIQVVGVIHDTYTGLEYQYREALDRILGMAERGEFDVLCMDVLDRGLGRMAVAREMYRMQLRELGIHILTTEPSDHSDDDSFEGQRARLQKGLKAQEEIIDMVRRTTNGRLQKALGNPDENVLPQVVGNGIRLYGYKYARDDKGTIIGYELNVDVIHTEPDGTKWTEVKVVRFIFESAANGVSTYKIAGMLNEKGIPTLYASAGKRRKGMTEDPLWQHANLSRMLKNTSYYGEYRYGQTVQVRVPGRKRPVRKPVPPEEHIIVPVPAIVTKELWEKANRRVPVNKPIATRNKKYSKNCLCRGGFARCAYCGYALRVNRNATTYPSGKQWVGFYYDCVRPNLKDGRCPGCTISVELLDNAAIEYIIELIRDPSVVDIAIQELLKGNPLKKRQQQKIKDLNKILAEQERLRANLSKEMRKKNLSEETVALLGRDLKELEQQAKEAREDLDNQQQVQQQYEDLDRRIAEFHAQCTEWREKLDTLEFTPDFHFYQEALIFFGITAKVWKKGTEPRYEFYPRPPAIVELLS